jgi:Rieske Fe-S protein
MDETAASAAVAALESAVDLLLVVPFEGLASAEVAALLRSVEVQRRRLEAVDQRLVVEVVERGIAGEYARTSPADLLVSLLRVTPAEGRARVGRAQDLGPRRALTGEPLEPILPATAAAVRAGEISSGHVRGITACLDAIPSNIAHEVAPVAERMLVEAARHEHPGQLARTAALLLARLDPDGAEPRDRDLERRRAFGLRRHQDGSSSPTGRFTPELTATLDTVLDSLAAPVPAAEGMPDDRSPVQRRHDALADALMRLLRSGTLPATGGVPVTIVARTSMTELQAGTGVATTGHGGQISISALLEMAAEAHVISAVCTDTGCVLAYGRSRRLASPDQRLALLARDGGCCFPGCDRPGAWCEVHHVRPWIDDGMTDLANMCLLCRYHHRQFESRGWTVEMVDEVPQWIPPAWIDQDRRPIRNTAHHLADFDFDCDLDFGLGFAPMAAESVCPQQP